MQPFLDLGQNYFKLAFHHWILEMQTRNYYLCSFHKAYFQSLQFQNETTNFLLIIECCAQWDLKGFTPYNTSLGWFEILQQFSPQTNNHRWSDNAYQEFCDWYKKQFLRANPAGKLKPEKLQMELVLQKLKTWF